MRSAQANEVTLNADPHPAAYIELKRFQARGAVRHPYVFERIHARRVTASDVVGWRPPQPGRSRRRRPAIRSWESTGALNDSSLDSNIRGQAPTLVVGTQRIKRP